MFAYPVFITTGRITYLKISNLTRQVFVYYNKSRKFVNSNGGQI